MRNFKDIILEKLKVSSKSASSFDDIFDDIMPCDFSEELFIDTAHILHKRAYTNVHEYYDLKNIYGDNLPAFYRSDSFEDTYCKCHGLFGDFDSTKPTISLVFNGHDDKLYSDIYPITKCKRLFSSLGKGDINKGVGILKYIADELK